MCQLVARHMIFDRSDDTGAEGDPEQDHRVTDSPRQRWHRQCDPRGLRMPSQREGSARRGHSTGIVLTVPLSSFGSGHDVGR